MPIDIDFPVGTVANPTRLGPLQRIHGTCSGPNPATTEIQLTIDWTGPWGTTSILLGTTNGLNGANTWYMTLGIFLPPDNTNTFINWLPPDGAPISVTLGFAAPPYTAWAVTSTLTGRFLWSPDGAWWNAAIPGGNTSLIQKIYDSVRKTFSNAP